MNKIYFIGKIPPPLGGVTIFNQRKFEQLKQDYAGNLKLDLLQPISRDFFKIIFALLSTNKKHLSASNFLVIILVIFFARPNTVIFYDHNSSRHFSSMANWKKMLYAHFFLKCFKIILVHEYLMFNYKIFNDYDDLVLKFDVESAFLPPSHLELNEILSLYDDKVLKLYYDGLNSGSRNIVLTSAFQPNLDNHGHDIYSIELLINIFINLCEKYRDNFFIIAIANYPQTDFSKKIKGKIESLNGLYENLIFIEGNKKIWPLLQLTKLFIRATTTDGDSISVREALYFDAPVLVSDIVPRPNGVMLFNLEKDNLNQKIDEYLGGSK